MAITWADVQAIAPADANITGTSVGVGAIFVTLAYAQMNTAAWGALLDIGARYLAAHLYTLSSPRGSGPVQEESVGDVSRVMNILQKDPQWDSNPYGREYKRMLRNLQIESRWLVVGGPNVAPPPFGGRFIP